MNDLKLAHPDPERLSAFAQGRLGEAELAELSAHLGDCTACRTMVEATGDDTLISLLRAADTAPRRKHPEAPDEAATLAPSPNVLTLPDLPAELAAHSRYRVQELLGVGGMGAVYKAEHLLMERPVALKLVSHNLTSHPEMVERFRREVKTAAKLRHPNIVLAYDAEQAGESHFLVIEYVEGKSLARAVAERGPLPVRQACDYIRQAALGLQYAHERGMVHRDIKPQNLMLTPEGQVKILDFGLARFAMEAAPTGALLTAPAAEATRGSQDIGSLTQVGTVLGTPDYIAPEQARDAHTADIRADIYSLGCTLYDLLAGHAPFPAGTAVDKVMAHLERSPKPLSAVRPDVPPALARVVERMLAKDPAQRYQTPAEVADALAPFAAAPIQPRRLWRTLVAAASLAAAVLLAGALVYVQTDHGEFEIRTEAERVAVMVNEKGVRIRDQSNGREYLLRAGAQDVRTGNYDLVVSELPDGLEIEGGKTFTIKRGGKAIATARLRAKTKRADVRRPRNPFGVPDVENPDAEDVKDFAAGRNLPDGAEDQNAQEWVTQVTPGNDASLDGEWFGRLRDMGSDWEYSKGRVQIKSVGARVYILFTDHEGRWLVEARREKGRLVGCMQGVDKRRDWRGACSFVIVSPERIDGESDAYDRIDFRRKLARTDRQRIQGTWKGVSASVQGQQVPGLLFQAVGPTITFADDKVTWRTNPTPEARDLFGGMLVRFRLDGIFHLDPTKSPRTVDLTVLGQNARTPIGTPAPRVLLGIYRLEGDSLELCIAIDPVHAEERPARFESVPGKFIAHVKLQRVPALPARDGHSTKDAKPARGPSSK
jgi:uncharacterized protein (TIGR03067 family)